MNYKHRFCILLTLFVFLDFNVVFGQINISGRVVDCEDKPMPGANIGIVKKEKRKKTIFHKRTFTDFNGHYKITVPDSNAILNFSSLGYATENIKVGNRNKIDVKLYESLEELEDVEVIGYKPIIYLYPESPIDVSLRFKYNGEVLVTYPDYNNEWNVNAKPDGTLINKADNREYSYLFWEGKRVYSENEKSYSEGFVVQQDSVVQFLQNILPEIGLTPREYNEFIVFWLPKLLENKWNFIHFRTDKEYNVISENSVTPKPDVEIRVFMEFKGVDSYFDITPQTFSNKARSGFSLVEWGGSYLEHDITIEGIGRK